MLVFLLHLTSELKPNLALYMNFSNQVAQLMYCANTLRISWTTQYALQSSIVDIALSQLDI